MGYLTISRFEELVDSVNFHITELDTLNELCESETNLEILPLNRPLTISTLRGIKSLHVTLRIPLQVFQAIDVQEQEAPHGSQQDIMAAALWSRIWPKVSSLGHLRRIEIEIDHVDPSSWSVVNERAILAPIAVLRKVSPDLDIVVILPHLHPRYESDDRHFTDNSARPTFSISRRTRQKYHYQEGPDGQGQVVTSRYDTPRAYSSLILDLVELQYDGQTMPFDWLEYCQEVEATELADWKRGVDVMDKYDALKRELDEVQGERGYI